MIDLKSFLKNNVKNGNLILDLSFYLDTNNSIDNFIARGQVTNFNSKIFKEILKLIIGLLIIILSGVYVFRREQSNKM